MSGKMGIILLMLTVAILFGALSLAFFSAPTVGAYEIPWLFYANTLVLIGSSALLQGAWMRRQEANGKVWIKGAIIMGGIFLLGQLAAYGELWQSGMWIDVSGRKMQFLYALSGLHGLHLIGGLIFLGVVLGRFQRNESRIFELALYFWHFLGVLWVYLMLVLILGV
ncbi:MAG: cytochrome c oxidase subunit 3 [Bacteroidia bacterium]|nr:cytochrome c oxidase subunit 3 [Bacteroidia bacterium]